LEAYEEHHVVDMVMAEIDGVAYDDEEWGAKFKVMKENLEHHIEEEEGEMFEQAKQVFDEDELAQFGEYMEARKEELMQQQSSTSNEQSSAAHLSQGPIGVRIRRTSKFRSPF
jgi:hypothetical protein